MAGNPRSEPGERGATSGHYSRPGQSSQQLPPAALALALQGFEPLADDLPDSFRTGSRGIFQPGPGAGVGRVARPIGGIGVRRGKGARHGLPHLAPYLFHVSTQPTDLRQLVADECQVIAMDLAPPPHHQDERLSERRRRGSEVAPCLLEQRLEQSLGRRLVAREDHVAEVAWPDQRADGGGLQRGRCPDEWRLLRFAVDDTDIKWANLDDVLVFEPCEAAEYPVDRRACAREDIGHPEARRGTDQGACESRDTLSHDPELAALRAAGHHEDSIQAIPLVAALLRPGRRRELQ